MKPQELMMLALRVLAVFIASQAFIYLAQGATLLVLPTVDGGNVKITMLSLAWLLGPSIAAIAVWCCAPYLARLATRGFNNEPISSLNSHTVISTTFVAAGTYIFITALPWLVSNLILAFNPETKLNLSVLVANILKCLLGIFLVIGSRATSRFLLRLRYAGNHTLTDRGDR